MHAQSSVVRAQRSIHTDRTRIAPPIPAKCPTEDQILVWEGVVQNTQNPLFDGAYAGAYCALAHGMLRWSDLQRSMQLRLTGDAITAVSPMKNQKYLTPWAAPRRGFNGGD